ncbi:MAG: hypothetical protein EA350_11510 [Gemmatimonadales bacterium]|nr:MAG: hypothetical protein EA350_11510 [Gemmatimonadales bacterium]
MLRAWLQPFMGVSTRRLPSYLAWYLLLTQNPQDNITASRLRAGIRASTGKAGHLIRARVGESCTPSIPLSGTRLFARLLGPLDRGVP